jgi:hypothetical protein
MSRQKSPDEIEQDIAATREHIDRTLDVLTARLSPSGLVDQALHIARDTGGEFTLNLGRAIRDNPVPTALIGVGLGWLMFAGRRREDDRYQREYVVEHAERSYDVGPTGVAPTSSLEGRSTDVPEDWSAAYDAQPPEWSGESDEETSSTLRERGQATKAAAEGAYERTKERAADARASLAATRERGADAAHRATERASASASEAGRRARDAGRRASERMHEARHRLSARASGAAAQARMYGSSAADRASSAYRQAGYAVRSAGGRAREATDAGLGFAREHPIAVGLALAAVGAAIAGLTPRTRREDELMGAASDDVKDAARDAANAQVERARAAASAAMDAGVEEARRAGLTPEGMKEDVDKKLAAGIGVARTAAEAGVDAAKGGGPDRVSENRSHEDRSHNTANDTASAPGSARVGGVSGIATPPVAGGSFGSTMDSRPVDPHSKPADDEAGGTGRDKA